MMTRRSRSWQRSGTSVIQFEEYLHLRCHCSQTSTSKTTQLWHKSSIVEVLRQNIFSHTSYCLVFQSERTDIMEYKMHVFRSTRLHWHQFGVEQACSSAQYVGGSRGVSGCWRQSRHGVVHGLSRPSLVVDRPRSTIRRRPRYCQERISLRYLSAKLLYQQRTVT